jgi:hypothetical protein
VFHYGAVSATFRWMTRPISSQCRRHRALHRIVDLLVSMRIFSNRSTYPSDKRNFMLRALAIAATLALLLSPAAAQNQNQKDEHKGSPPPQHSGGGGPPPSKPAFVPQQHSQGSGGPPPSHPEFKPAFVPHPGPPGPPPPHGPIGGPPVFHPGGPQFTYHGHPFDPVHGRPFRYPPGWAYRQWAIGAILPPLFLTPDYYYPDWAALGLDPPPPGDEWVRYGPDMLLVDTTTGQVVEAVYGVFYDD